MQKVTAIIVAAGSSSRMKTIKQLLPFRDTSLLGRVIAQAQASSVNDIVTVLGANFERIEKEIRPLITRIVRNEEWEQGLGSSIAAAMRTVRENEQQPDGVLILLGDQPIVDAPYLEKLLDTFRNEPNKIVATRYPKSKGVPAIFPPQYFSELEALDGDAGAKYLLNRDSEMVLTIQPFDKTLDIDTPEDYRYLRSKYE